MHLRQSFIRVIKHFESDPITAPTSAHSSLSNIQNALRIYSNNNKNNNNNNSNNTNNNNNNNNNTKASVLDRIGSKNKAKESNKTNNSKNVSKKINSGSNATVSVVAVAVAESQVQQPQPNEKGAAQVTPSTQLSYPTQTTTTTTTITTTAGAVSVTSKHNENESTGASGQSSVISSQKLEEELRKQEQGNGNNTRSVFARIDLKKHLKQMLTNHNTNETNATNNNVEVSGSHQNRFKNQSKNRFVWKHRVLFVLVCGLVLCLCM